MIEKHVLHNGKKIIILVPEYIKDCTLPKIDLYNCPWCEFYTQGIYNLNFIRTN